MVIKRKHFFNICLFIFIVIQISCDLTQFPQGKSLYENNCMACHMNDGSGVASLYPSLNNLAEKNTQLNDIPCIIRNGLKREGALIEMLGLNHLSDVEINNIVNYVVNDMNNIGHEITIQETKSELQKCN